MNKPRPSGRGVDDLTGAGFTKNFGGFLSQEMWVRVFNTTDYDLDYWQEPKTHSANFL